jgi:hypothetical protein
MAPVPNKQVIFAEIPQGLPEPGKHTKLVTSQIDPDTVSLNGGLLTKNIALCLCSAPASRSSNSSAHL